MDIREEVLLNLVAEHRESQKTFVYFIVGLELALCSIVLLQRNELPLSIHGYLRWFYLLSFAAAIFGILSRLFYRRKLGEELKQFDPNVSKENIDIPVYNELHSVFMLSFTIASILLGISMMIGGFVCFSQ